MRRREESEESKWADADTEGQGLGGAPSKGTDDG